MSSRHGRSEIAVNEKGIRISVTHPARGNERYARVSFAMVERPSTGPNGTEPQTCVVLIPAPGSPNLPPIRCGDKRFASGRCVEHWKDWKNAKAARGLDGDELLKLRHAGDEKGKLPSRPKVLRVSPRMGANAGKFRDDDRDSQRQYAAQVKRERKRAKARRDAVRSIPQRRDRARDLRRAA